MQIRRIVVAMVVLGTLGACSAGAADPSSDQDPTDVEPTTGPATDGDTTVPPTVPVDAAPVTTLPRPTTLIIDDAGNGDPVEQEVAVIGPVTFDEVIDFGIEAGIWDEREGLTRVLGWLFDDVATDQVPGIEEVRFPDLSAVLRRANALALGNEYDEADLATLRKYYEVFAPPAEALDSTPSASPSDFAGPQGFAGRSTQAAANGCSPIDPDDWDPAVIFATCYDRLSKEVAGVQLRVFVPRSFADDPVALNLGPTALSALEHSVLTYQDLGTIGDMDLIITDAQLNASDGLAGVAGSTAQWDTLTVVGCPISMLGNAWDSGPEEFEQVVAHEAWHCVQHYDGFPETVPAGTAWYIEGGAEFFSNVAYPSNNHEISSTLTFDSRSLTMPLHRLSYDAWIWWQYLSNQYSERYVADLHRSMTQSGGNGVDQIADLDEMFHNFIVEFTAGTIKDQDGGAIDRAHQYLFIVGDITKEFAGRERTIPVEQFVGARFQLAYQPKLRVFQSDVTTTGGRFSAVERQQREILSEWTGLPPEVRSKCNDKAWYVFVGTSLEADQTFTMQIDRVEEAACDPCVLGTWSMRLDTFKSMIQNGMAAEGGALPDGITWDFGGAYNIQFVDDEVVREQRDRLAIMFGMQNVGNFSVVIDSFAEGTYTADGERLVVNSLVESYNLVTANIPGGGSGTFPSALDQGTGTYECGTETLTISVDGFDPVVWDRIDKILEPQAGDVTTTGG